VTVRARGSYIKNITHEARALDSPHINPLHNYIIMYFMKGMVM